MEEMSVLSIVPEIPRYTLGLDIETKDVVPSSYILAIGAVLYDNHTLKVIATWRIDFDPNDPEQGNRTVCERTVDWWNTRKPGNAFPSQQAYDLTWNGTTKFKDGMQQFAKYMNENPRNGVTVVPMRGPDFDYVILRDALKDAGINYRMPARNLDSHRTVERVISALGIPPASENEVQRWWKGPEPLHHVAVFDAAWEGYETARMYHILHCFRLLGYDGTMEMVKSWSEAAKPLEEYTVDYMAVYNKMRAGRAFEPEYKLGVAESINSSHGEVKEVFDQLGKVVKEVKASHIDASSTDTAPITINHTPIEKGSEK